MKNRFSSIDHFGVSIWKLVCTGALISTAASLAVGALVGDSLGEARPVTLLIIATLVFYIIISTPRRTIDRQRVAQARESILLAAGATACLDVTGSRSRTLVLLRPRETTLAAATREAARRVMLGSRVGPAVEASTHDLPSYSASLALQRVATLNPGEFDAGDEETSGITTSADLSRETKLPMFMTVCFFAPIMLTIYAVFTHDYDVGRIAQLGAFEFVAIDIAFYLTSAESGRV